ncbi:unnamed protein product [Adineta steineri]|uniref:Cupin type-1 domain-containing protein n=1 Tax=Adineta steineri TaxID=433720 RepID=A0A819N7M5_9BILA|nr:unnamed protein product [Adineta steineri]CAF3991302.1 unnamed protein product [Adineta steineri]
MELIQFLCLLIIFYNVSVSQQLSIRANSPTTTTRSTSTTKPTTKSTSTTKPTTSSTSTTRPFTTTSNNVSNASNPLAPSRLESIKNSYSELNLLSKTNPSDFIFDFDKAVTGVSTGTGGRTVSATAANFPGLINHGIAMTIGFLAPCGINLPHTHPRATEINFSVDGDFQIGFFQENGASFIMNEIHKNQVAVFPKGAIHFEQNLNCVSATFVAAFNSKDPGVLTIGNSFFGSLPATVVGASLGGLNITTIEDIRVHLVQNPSIGIAECKKRCGLYTFKGESFMNFCVIQIKKIQ